MKSPLRFKESAYTKDLQRDYTSSSTRHSILSPSSPSRIPPPIDGDLSSYYQRMAEEYRQKYLDLERDFNQYRLTKEHEM